MTRKKNTQAKPLAILAAISLSLMGGPLATAATASDRGFRPQPTANPYSIAQNQQQCTVNSAADPRGGVDLRNNPTGQNIGFVNNGGMVNAQQFSPDGKWRWVITQDGTQQGWVYEPYLNCGGRQANNNLGSSNRTGGIAIGTTCAAVGSPQYPNIPILNYPNATGNQIGNFAKGTQLRVVTPPPGQQSQRKWTYVQSVQNPGQKGWVWAPYVACN